MRSVNLDKDIVENAPEFTQVTVGTTAVQLTTKTRALKTGLIIKALAANAGTVYVGTASVTTSVGFELSAGEGVKIPVEDASSLYAIASAVSQGVCLIAQ